MDCTKLRESTEVERMVSVRPRRNILSDALSYVAQARPYILGHGGESHTSESVLGKPCLYHLYQAHMFESVSEEVEE